ncbi:zinc-binding dehydrogenase [Streptococcus gallolyticus subsp. gallolyticus]|uniref:zinc-binding dehydrogenase n=1 Tax=Streptococcus gallolyticus TaxID=315405 RepID=UPI0022840AB5|nr:zinc-binding dehydrogenase [Streptococcus gallolyticus]MCY7171947.1 zinc-binding dehydrogenase [Streptococcus gallolyticus subsp. gallolyticus]
MKAVVVSKAGDSSVLEVTQVAKPQVKSGWSLVKVMGFGINRSEIFTRQGLSPSVTFPRILGIECVGVIEETTDPSRLPVGQKIISIMGEMGRDFDGSYAEYVLLPNEQIYPVTTDLDWKTLTTIPETYYTAFGAYKNLKIGSDDVVLVRGGASGVGTAFVKLMKAKFPEVKVYASVRTAAKKEQLLSVGYDDLVIDDNGILKTDLKFTKILELVGPATIKNSIAHLEENGIVCSCGQLGKKWYLEDFDPIMELQNNIYLTTFYSGNVSQEKIQEMLTYIEQEQVDVRPECVFDLDNIQAAHDYLESVAAFGKVIILNKEENFSDK